MVVTEVLEKLSRRPDGSFLDIAEFNGRSVGACSIAGARKRMPAPDA